MLKIYPKKLSLHFPISILFVESKSNSSIALSISWLMPRSLVIRLPVPPGIMASLGMCSFSARPEMTSFTVPSPPKANTAS